MNFKELKLRAKESLKGKWGNTIGIMFLYAAIPFVLGFIKGILGIEDIVISAVIDLIVYILEALFYVGYISYFLRLSRDENVEINELWSKANMLVPYIIVTIYMSLLISLWLLVFIIPGIIAALKYSMTYYIMLDNPGMKAADAIEESKRIMEGHKLEYLELQLSFIGWEILGIFTFGILYLWLIPYMTVTTCNYYNQIKNHNINNI